MKIAFDVQYDDDRGTAQVAAVVFRDWGDATSVAEYVHTVNNVVPYVSGRFFERELPLLLTIYDEACRDPRSRGAMIDTAVVDAYVWLGTGRPGLGKYLHDAIGLPVVGIAKNPFREAEAVSVPVLRGNASSRPLYATSIGIDVHEAAGYVAAMHGAHRIPTLLKRVDHLARGIV